MKITIMNGNGNPQNQDFDEYVARLTAQLTAEGHTVTAFTLREMDIKFCTGCFGCWMKTPGQCAVKDASHDVCRAVINGDFLLWAAPLRMGFPDATLKKMMDKSIPLIHPYFVVDHGEAHHRPRYDHYPRIGLLLEKEADTDAEDLRLVSDIFSRTALNMKSCLEFALTTEEPVETVAHAIVTETADGVPFDRARYRDTFAASEAVLVGFPLYTDAMPGIVKTFIEALEPLRGRSNNPALGFVMQSGFPESTHLRHVERYLAKLAARLGSPYLGALIKGGGEGIRLMPDNMNRKLFDQLIALGQSLRTTGQFPLDAVQKLAKPERYPAYLMPVFKVLVKSPVLSMYWNNQLKENGVYDQRFAQPFVEQ
jgi:multimeric flavodoxin WrbA